jgi:hypothetical protein
MGSSVWKSRNAVGTPFRRPQFFGSDGVIIITQMVRPRDYSYVLLLSLAF